jgi:hypothetical protein
MNKTYLAITLIAFVMISFFALQKPYVPPVPSGGGDENLSPASSGITNVRTLWDGKGPLPGTVGGNVGSNKVGAGTNIPHGFGIAPKAVPYPRIEIHYSLSNAGSINGVSANKGYYFLVTNIQIQNFGYKYFDAHPSKFVITNYNTAVAPSVDVSTGNMLNSVLPNNSITKGDLVFSLNTHFGAAKLEYVNGDYGYTILWNGAQR